MGVGVAGSQPQQGAACLGLPRRREVRASIRTQDLTGGGFCKGVDETQHSEFQCCKKSWALHRAPPKHPPLQFCLVFLWT